MILLTGWVSRRVCKRGAELPLSRCPLRRVVGSRGREGCRKTSEPAKAFGWLLTWDKAFFLVLTKKNYFHFFLNCTFDLIFFMVCKQ